MQITFQLTLIHKNEQKTSYKNQHKSFGAIVQSGLKGETLTIHNTQKELIHIVLEQSLQEEWSVFIIDRDVVAIPYL